MVEQRLPAIDGDEGHWGEILNQFLSKEHRNTGLDDPTNGGHQKITIQPGTAAAGTAPLKFTSGTLLTTPEAGAVEFDTDTLYVTQTTGTTRKKIATYDDTSGATGDIYYRNSSGYFTRLGIGSTGNVLTVAGGIPSWSSSISNTSTITLKDTNFTLQDDGNTTKQLKFELSGISASTTRTLTVPDANTTLVGTDATQTLTNKTLTSPRIGTSLLDTNGNTMVSFTPTASAVVYLDIKNQAGGGAGTGPFLSPVGPNASHAIYIQAKGNNNTTSYIALGNSGYHAFKVMNTVTAGGNLLAVLPANSGGTPALTSAYSYSADANVGLDLQTKGAGVVQANGVEVATISGTQTLTNKTLTSPRINQINDTNGNTSIALVATASAVSYLHVTNAATGSFAIGGGVVLRPESTDSDVNLIAKPRGSGYVGVSDSASGWIAKFARTAGVNANYWNIQGGSAGGAVTLTAAGTDSSINANIVSKGTGTVQANGVDVVTTTGTQTLTNKTISGASNTLSNIPQSAVTNLTTDITTAQTAADTAQKFIDLKASGLPNIASDPSCSVPELWAANGFGSNWTGEVSNEQAVSGTQSLKMTITGSSYPTLTFLRTKDGDYIPDIDSLRVRPGDKFYMEVYIRAHASNAVTNTLFYIQAWSTDSTGVNGYAFINSTGVAPSTSGWTKLTHTYTVPAGRDRLNVRLAGSLNNGIGDIYYVDNLLWLNVTDTQDIIDNVYQGINGGSSTWNSLATMKTAVQSLVTLTGTQTLTNKTLTSPKINQILDSNGVAVLGLTTTASAANYVNIRNKAAGSGPFVETAGSDTDIPLNLSTKGTGLIHLSPGGTAALQVGYTASSVNYFRLTGSATGSGPTLFANGTDTNVDMLLTTKGSGVVKANGVEVVTVDGTQTLTNKTITSPVINSATGISVGSAVSPTGSSNPPKITFDQTYGTNSPGSNANQKIQLYTGYGFGVSGSMLEYQANTGAVHRFFVGGSERMSISGSDVTIGGVSAVTTTGTQTLTNKTFTSPTINTAIIDSLIGVGATDASQTNAAYMTDQTWGRYPAFSPAPKYLWHDVLRFSRWWGDPTFETYDGSTWSSQTLNNSVFAGNEYTAVRVADGTTTTGARWTWNSANITAGYVRWWMIHLGYVGTAPTNNFTIEGSTDGTNWTTYHTSQVTGQNQPVLLQNTVGLGSCSWARLTITTANARPIDVNSIKALSSRTGAQGGGQELEYPYSWDGDKNIITLANLRVNTPSNISKSAATVDGTQTLTNKTLTTPSIDTIKDINGATMMAFSATASANDYFMVANSAGGNPVLYAVGASTNISTIMQPKGTGTLGIYVSTGMTPTLEARGVDTNHNLNLLPKGTGTVQANGVDIVTISGTQTLTNKTISASSNTISNIAVSNLDASAVVTAAETIAANNNDTTIPTSAAVKSYVDSTGSGDASTNTATSVDSEVAVFSGTTGKLLKRATGSGIAKLTSGVLSVVTAPSGTIVGTTDAQTLTNKTLTTPTINGATITGTVQLPEPNQLTVPSASLTNKNYAISNDVSIGAYPAFNAFSKYLWHDILRFGRWIGTGTYETYASGSWSSATNPTIVFAGKESGAYTLADGATTTAVRWTWNSGNLSYSGLSWIMIGFGYGSPAPSNEVTVESGTDGTNWTTRHTSTTTANATFAAFPLTGVGGDTYLRLTITTTNSRPIYLNSIKGLTNRPANQGGGADTEYPYDWDANRNITLGAGITARSDGILNIGSTTTTTAAGGIYFGNDTNLYRSAANTLKTDDNLAIGTSTQTATATPANINLGGTYGNNTVGTQGNLKLRLYDNGSGSNHFGLGISDSKLEYQVPNGSGHHFYVNGIERLKITNSLVQVAGADVVTTTGTQTLTNKTISLANNTLTTTFAQLNTAVSDVTLIKPTSLFNNMGDAHTTRTSFDAQGAASTIDFGWRYVQGSTNGPGTNGASQYYSAFIGLGEGYAYSSYGMQLAFPRNVSNPYISIRYEESGALGAWQKISAGDSDKLGGTAAASYVTLTGTQTLTNKTLTSPTISGTPVGVLTSRAVSSGNIGGAGQRISTDPNQSSDAMVVEGMANDLVYADLRGGSITMTYNGGAPTYTYNTPATALRAGLDSVNMTIAASGDVVVAEVTLPSGSYLRWGFIAGINMSPAARANDVTIEVWDYTASTWRTIHTVTNEASAQVWKLVSSGLWSTLGGTWGNTVSKIRYTLTNFAQAGTNGLAIVTLYAVNTGSQLGAAQFLTRNGGDLYGTNAVAPTISANGGDTNIDLKLSSKGTGVVKANNIEVATISGTQTLTNKTLTSPAITGNTTVTGNLTVDNGTSTIIDVISDDTGSSGIRLYGASQGTGYVEVGQSTQYGGGMYYNGDGSPAFASGEVADTIGFYRNNNNVKSEVFYYSYANDNVVFNGAIYSPTVYVGGVAVPSISSTDTLTNKTLSGSSNTFSNIPQSAVTNLTTDLATSTTNIELAAMSSNLIPDPNFEDTTVTRYGFGAVTPTYTNTEAFQGTYSLTWTATSSTWQGPYFSPVQSGKKRFVCRPGDAFRVKVKIKPDAANNMTVGYVRIFMRFWTTQAGGTYTNRAAGTYSISNSSMAAGWQDMDCFGICPDDKGAFEAFIINDPTTTNGNVYYLDCVGVEQISYGQEVVDAAVQAIAGGSSTGYSIANLKTNMQSLVTLTGAQTLTNKTLTSPTVSNYINTDEIRPTTGNQIIINVGESSLYATGQTGEFLYVNAENGLQINSSPDNWVSGWAARKTASINDASGNSSLPGDLTVTGTITSGGVSVPTTSSTSTLTNKTLTSPKITYVNDSNGNISIYNPAAASAVNYLAISNSATGNPVVIGPTGADAQLAVNLQFRGTTKWAGMQDGQGNYVGKFFSSGVSTVNYPTFKGTYTGNGPIISVDGTDTNIDLLLVGKGTGVIKANGNPVLSSVTAVPAVTGTPSASTYLRGDGTWAAVGGGDASTNTASSVDSEVALFSGTGGKTLKRATGSGIAKLTSGVLSAVTAPSGTIVGTTDAQTLTNKTLTSPTVNGYTEGVVAIGTVTTSYTLAITSGTVLTATLTASTACTFTMPTATAGKSFTLMLKQAASTGNGTATFTGVKWNAAGAPTITATAGKMDILFFTSDGTSWYGTCTQGFTP